jgi:hypothetical protein
VPLLAGGKEAKVRIFEADTTVVEMTLPPSSGFWIFGGVSRGIFLENVYLLQTYRAPLEAGLLDLGQGGADQDASAET